MRKECVWLVGCVLVYLTVTSGAFGWTDVISGTMSTEIDAQPPPPGVHHNYIIDIVDPGGGIVWIEQKTCDFLDYNLTPVQQTIQNFNRDYSLQPNSTQHPPDPYGNQYELARWDDPPQGVITTSITFVGIIENNLAGLVTDADFPPPPPPPEVQPYLERTDMTQSDDPQIIAEAQAATAGDQYEFEAVTHIEDYVREHIEYAVGGPQDAVSVLNRGTATCAGFAHLACAVMKAVGIPAKYVSGGSMQSGYFVPGPGGSQIWVDWGEGTHAWVEVWYPDFWIPYDPQRFYHYQHTHAYRVGWGRDTGDVPNAKWRYLPGNPPPDIRFSVDVNLERGNENRAFQFVKTLPTPNYPAFPCIADDARSGVGVSDQERSLGLPACLVLHQNFSNPFSSGTTISYQVPAVEGRALVDCSLCVYELSGKLVTTLISEQKPAGSYDVTWDGKDDRGNEVSSGIYFYRLKTGEFSETKKMARLK